MGFLKDARNRVNNNPLKMIGDREEKTHKEKEFSCPRCDGEDWVNNQCFDCGYYPRDDRETS